MKFTREKNDVLSRTTVFWQENERELHFNVFNINELSTGN